MRRAAQWWIGGGLVVVAGLISGITPSDQALLDPFAQRGAAEEEIVARTFLTHGAEWSFADRVTVEEDEWSADGNWLVIEVTASARTTEVGTELSLASLTVDGRIYHSSERTPESLLRTPLRVGIPTTGMLAFELPAGVRTGTAELRLSTDISTPWLDDVISIPIDLDAADTTKVIDIPEPEVGRS